MDDAKHQGYTLAEILDLSLITRLSFPCEPAPEELEEWTMQEFNKRVA